MLTPECWSPLGIFNSLPYFYMHENCKRLRLIHEWCRSDFVIVVISDNFVILSLLVTTKFNNIIVNSLRSRFMPAAGLEK